MRHLCIDLYKSHEFNETDDSKWCFHCNSKSDYVYMSHSAYTIYKSLTTCVCFSVISGVFALLNAYSVLKYVQSFLTKAEFKFFFIVSVGLAAGVIFLAVVGLTWAGKLVTHIISSFHLSEQIVLLIKLHSC